MSKPNFNADKKTGLPPKTTTRLSTPDPRLNGPQMPQSARKAAIFQNKPRTAFQRVGSVGPGE